MPKLAINGGPKTIKKSFPSANPIGPDAIQAGIKVLRSGNLSGFFGSWNERFLGGPEVQAFEHAWAKHFKVKYAISFNSLTSGLVASIGAIGIEPGEEVITSPWTMSATATAILVWGGIPVFADIEEDTYNLDPKSILKNITPQTRAIIVPDIFGNPANLNEIMRIAKKHNLKVIEDAAQAPNSKYGVRRTGTIADIGGFSLNYHKHLHTGEGGMMVTNNKKLAERMQLIRNHGEAVVGPKGEKDISNIIGFNFRLGEIEAAIGLTQLKKIDALTRPRTDAGTLLTKTLRKLPGLIPPKVTASGTHVYYIYAFRIDEHITGVSREKLVAALAAEGVPWVYPGYQLVHLLPIYQQKIAQGKKGFPWTKNVYKGSVSYKKGICPVAERLHEKELVCLQICQHRYTKEETRLVIKAFEKVWANLDELRG